MTEQWQELKETIIELRDNDGTGTQQEVCKFLANLMDILEKQMSNLEKPNKWIPVSEKFPEDGTYLICTDDGYIATIMYDRSMGWLLSANIIAYMPLQQPYKAESDGEE